VWGHSQAGGHANQGRQQIHGHAEAEVLGETCGEGGSGWQKAGAGSEQRAANREQPAASRERQAIHRPVRLTALAPVRSRLC
jgi:hypothetical protein